MVNWIMGKKTIKILSLPSRHPYMSKFNIGKEIKFVNPDTNLFTNTQKFSENFLNQYYPSKSYDIVHIHFSFDRTPINQFEKILKYFHKNNKPIIWTCHSKESLRIKGYENGRYQKLLFQYADQIISPTRGCAQWLSKNFGKHKNPLKVVPLGFMAHPDEVRRLDKKIKKTRNLFTMLIGDFRQNKEFVQSIMNFLQCSELKKVKLQLIFKPINIYNENGEIKPEMVIFQSIIQHSRIRTISLPNISNDIITKAFLASHAVILPYKWGTHSGQIELAKDCGCHIIVSDVGYYKEQWDKIHLWKVSDKNYSEFPIRYTNALIETYREKPLKLAGEVRKIEFNKIFNDHLNIYKNILKKKSRL